MQLPSSYLFSPIPLISEITRSAVAEFIEQVHVDVLYSTIQIGSAIATTLLYLNVVCPTMNLSTVNMASAIECTYTGSTVFRYEDEKADYRWENGKNMSNIPT